MASAHHAQAKIATLIASQNSVLFCSPKSGQDATSFGRQHVRRLCAGIDPRSESSVTD